MVAVVFPGDFLLEQLVANAANRTGRNGKDSVVAIGVDEGVRTVCEVAGIVVVEQIVVMRLAVRVNRTRQ